MEDAIFGMTTPKRLPPIIRHLAPQLGTAEAKIIETCRDCPFYSEDHDMGATTGWCGHKGLNSYINIATIEWRARDLGYRWPPAIPDGCPLPKAN